ncbi:hypothetical protein ACFLWX_02300 [Chloroflexota bacterium]
MAAALLKQWDSGCNPVLVRPVQNSHTVCAFTSSEGGLWFFGIQILRREDLQTYEDVAARVGKRICKLICWDARDPDTLEMIECSALYELPVCDVQGRARLVIESSQANVP